jgi:adenylate cyclase class 1
MKNISGSAIDKQRKSFDAYNIHRVLFANNNFSSGEHDFFNAVPVLLHHDFVVPDILEYTPPAPTGIHDFTPAPMQMASLKSLFPGEEVAGSDKGPSIHSLALVGSIGTVAQTEESDFDYVVFVSNEELGEANLASLRVKLDAIESWAMRTIGREVHFFISDKDEFRDNRFGETDRENVGSALGKLFKDEFYRTAVFIAGKRPLWWLIPTGFPEDSIEEFIKYAARKDSGLWDKYLDLGHVLTASEEEFFGGALWQMNKALHSPFKSLLKMGLLESYLLNPESGLLCEELKKRLMESEKIIVDIDPYIMMLNRITDYYLKHGMEKEAQFLRAAFLQKSGITIEKAEELQSGEGVDLSEKEKYITSLLKEWSWSSYELEEFNRLLTGESKNRYQSLGEMNRFFLDAYKRLDDKIKESGRGEASISGDDMAVLGRKLFVYFDRRSDKERRLDKDRKGDMGRRASMRRGEKVPYIYPGNAPDEPLKECSLSVGKADDGSRAWMLYDFIFPGATSDVMRNFRPPIMYFLSLSQLLGWMIINGIWQPGSKVYFDSAMSGYQARDVNELLVKLYNFFVKDKSYRPQREDYISANERIVMAFVIPNFGLKDSPGLVERADILMLNSWGELTHMRRQEMDACNEVSDMMMIADSKKKSFTMEVVPPPSQEDPGLADEFRLRVSKLNRLWEAGMHMNKKATLDI